MTKFDELIDELSDLAGIIPEYYDIFGKKHVTSHGSRIAILTAMGLGIEIPEEVSGEIEKIKMRRWFGILDPVTVISVHAQPHRLAVHLPLPEGKEQAMEIVLSLEDEQGKKEALCFPEGAFQVDEQRIIKNRRFVRILLPLPRKEMGYYNVSVTCSHPDALFDAAASSLEKSARLIITPDSCYMPEQLIKGKTWGVATNLYALRSERNWGIGDLGDLRRLVHWLSGLNAGLIGINPLHAIPNTAPFGISPYSPVSRLYRNFIYIDIESVPEISEMPPKDRPTQLAHFSEKISSLKKGEHIDYEEVAAVKRVMLEHAFDCFYSNHYKKASSRSSAFHTYLQAEGEPLEKFSLFLALSEYMRKERNAHAWQEWPDEYRDGHSDALKDFKRQNEKSWLFFAYIQWLIDTQMADISAAASAAGMPVGLYGDLAIGSIDIGSDVWMYQDVVAEQVTVGAPPDDFNPNGQNWGFPPMIPEKLRESGYELFIQTIRKNMQHMGALRIDHALGLFRLFWIPKGFHAQDGAFVRCNSEDLLRIIALESVRNRTLVIGEDLGTITDEARQALHRFDILSYRLFYFERNYPDRSFIPPERYPEMSLCAVTTHDLPTLYGYWSGRDIDVKRQLRIIDDESQYALQKRDRERDRELILKALATRGILPGCSSSDSSMTPELCGAIYNYLSVSPSKLVLVSLDDIIGTIEQQNLPGTVSEHPNWMQKSELLLEEIIADPRWQDVARLFRNTRAGSLKET